MKYLIATLCLFAFVGCKDTKNTAPVTNDDTHRETSAIHDNNHNAIATSYDNSWMEEIEMNDGSKWDANDATNEGVQEMQNHLESHTTKTLEDYHKLASTLNEDKNFVIKNCTMKR